MFEFSVARKYLAPRRRQLSVSIISLISILVIALVVWLIVVFFSVTNGLEKGWVQKLIALTSPVRVTPTQAYYDSYYYLVDGISGDSDYTLKSIGEKRASSLTDPYNAESDEEPPAYWSKPVLNEDGSLKDIVQDTFAIIEQIPNIPGLTAKDYEVTMGQLRLRLLRPASNGPSYQKTKAVLNQASYIGSLDHENASLHKALLPVSLADLSNAWEMLAEASNTDNADFRADLNRLLEMATIQELKTPEQGWMLPRSLYPNEGKLTGIAIYQGNRLVKFIVPQKLTSDAELKEITFINKEAFLDKKVLAAPVYVEGGISFAAELKNAKEAEQFSDLKFAITLPLQSLTIKGSIAYNNLLVGKADFHLTAQQQLQDTIQNNGILLPKTFRDAGVLIGDTGHLVYYSPTASSVQEQKLPIRVTGFYDPGIIPIGGKFALANPEIVNLIRSSQNQDEATYTNGINVRFNNLADAEKVKDALIQALKREGLDAYWKVETYKEYDFTKDLLQQLQSDKTLFTLISAIIILVACSNIISMLIILVNDKKVEIGILRSMGASGWSIALIFGTCGIVMGVMGSLIGTVAAVITLKNLDVLITFLSSLQGHNAFNPMFYGETLPNEVSFEALLFVIGATGLISLIAGVVPAIKASLLRPSTILRSE